MKETNRYNVAAYVADERHLRGPLRGAKTLTQMAAELGTTTKTMRRWLRRDHWDLWMEHWASADELLEVGQRERTTALSGQTAPKFLLRLEPFCESDADQDANFDLRTFRVGEISCA
jgi:hypothetical protein